MQAVTTIGSGAKTDCQELRRTVLPVTACSSRRRSEQTLIGWQAAININVASVSSRSQFLQQRLRLFQIAHVESLSERAKESRESLSCFVPFPLTA